VPSVGSSLVFIVEVDDDGPLRLGPEKTTAPGSCSTASGGSSPEAVMSSRVAASTSARR
jgi:hypothetical protein